MPKEPANRRAEVVIAAVAAGQHEVVRFTWRQISDEPATVVAVMSGLLARP